MKSTISAVVAQLNKLDDNGLFAGYASVFGVIDTQMDMVMPGAFIKSLAKQNGGKDVRLLWQHDTAQPIGYVRAVKEDEYGLFVEGQLVLDVQQGKEAYALLQHEALKGISIGYTPIHYDIDPDTGVRLIHEVDLWEISLVTFPANLQAQVEFVKGGVESRI